MRLHGKDYSAASLARMAGDLAAAGGVRSVVLGDGAERGVRALEFRTGSGLDFDVLGAYAVGFEPSTHAVIGDQAARDDGTMTWLVAGESLTYSTTFRIIDAAFP